MTKKASALGFAAVVAITAGAAQAVDVADKLLIIDLTVENQVTITATDGLSSSTVSGPDLTGVYLEDFFAADGVSSLNASLVSGDLTNFENPSDGTPSIFRDGTTDRGLNIFSFSSDFTVTFTADSQAFTGSAVFTLEADDFADMFAGGERSGNIFFPADSVDDLDSAEFLGTYHVIVPAPAALPLMGLGLGLGAMRRRR